jgi:predicted nucleic acid-binding protein
MKIYLDMCCLKRPFDDQGSARIQMETVSVLGILRLCQEGVAELISSDALLFENERNPNAMRRELTTHLLNLSKVRIANNPALESRALELEKIGVPLIDALHLASAEASADVFCTCDDELLRKARSLPLRVRVITPAALAEEVLS